VRIDTGVMSAGVFRFAPSPNGYLHLGHAASAWLNFELARRTGGRFLLRIEDIDLGRTREGFVEAIYEDLAWLGFDWEEPVLRQSQNFCSYQSAADRLADLGVLYPCFATRAEIGSAAREAGLGLDPDGAPVYPGLHRGMSSVEIGQRKDAGQPFAMRIDMARAVDLVDRKLAGGLTYRELLGGSTSQRCTCDPIAWGDVIVQRKDVPTSYHLAVVVDDAGQGVTHIVRGADLQKATAIHRLLQVLLDLPEPVYLHHGLVLDEGGRKLSKSDSATSLRSLREAGLRPEDILNRLRLELDVHFD
jgi:glutamyl-Q tRNA(Asp) synthetase